VDSSRKHKRGASKERLNARSSWCISNVSNVSRGILAG
jgi:hypothetical protein